VSRLVYCKKLNKELPGLNSAPYPGALGQRIYNEISQEAWDLWLKRQTMFINEHHFNFGDKEARAKANAFLRQEMEKFLFEDQDNTPAGYVAPEN
jgi:Fe-S cluster biosynthesis and repair protein YggX